tara:strand:+ start:1621 stop:2634 length:1014 start_codon:yes stop_codon:yes gene_type:complete
MATSNKNHSEKLVDSFNRHINYVRISVTDRCDFRCIYCMSEEMEFVPRAQLLTLEEISTIAHVFTLLGINKIRITGGEPLIRKNVITLFNKLGSLDGLEELTTTTNGSQLMKLAIPLKEAGVNRINISLDSLKPDRFKRITRTGNLDKVLNGIDKALSVGFDKIKINTVILKNRNHDEIIDLVSFAVMKNIDISFIEEMPLGLIDDHDRTEMYYSSDEIKEDIQKKFELISSTESTGGPSKYFQIHGSKTKVGFISPHSHNFCDQCNRIRLTAEGRLLLCLGQENSVDLKKIIRAHPGNNEKLKESIRNSMHIKPKGHDFNTQDKPIIFRHMNVTGG